jgi:hypothetical protein
VPRWTSLWELCELGLSAIPRDYGSTAFAKMSAHDIANDNASAFFFSEILSRSLYLFGAAVSAIAIISLIQGVLDVHLMPTQAHWLSVGRDFIGSTVTLVYAPFVLAAERAATWLHFPLRIDIPEWWKDLAALSTLNAAANLRGSIAMRNRRLSVLQTLGYIVAIWIYGVTLLGLVLFAIPLLSIALLMPPNDQEDRALNRVVWSIWRPYLLSLLSIAVATVAFFVTNAYQL